MKLIFIILLSMPILISQTLETTTGTFKWANGFPKACEPYKISGLFHEDDPGFCTIPVKDPPATGNTWIDPNLGGKVTVLTDAPRLHEYSSPSPVSAQNKYVLTFNQQLQEYVINRETQEVVKVGIPGNVNNGIWWDATNSELLYYLEGSQVKSYRLNTDQSEALIDLSAEGITQLTTKGTGSISEDNWIAAVDEGTSKVCMLDTSARKSYCTDYSQIPRGMSVDFPTIAPGIDSETGKRYALIIGSPSVAVFSLQGDELVYDFRLAEYPSNHQRAGNSVKDGVCSEGEACLSGRHQGVGQTKDGRQFIFTFAETQTPLCASWVVLYYLHNGPEMLYDGEYLHLWGRCGGIPGWAPGHFGCASKEAACVATSYSNMSPTVPDPQPIGNKLNEIVRYYNTSEGWVIERIAKSRSHPFSYWDLPRAAISRDGQIIIADSNFGVQGNRRVTSIETSETITPPVWEVSQGELPNGLSLNGVTGHISGIPLKAGIFEFTIKATVAVGIGIKEYTITIEAEEPVAVVIKPDELPLGQVNESYMVQLILQ
jgi:hypothetical protein